jgi:hypothetical protein
MRRFEDNGDRRPPIGRGCEAYRARRATMPAEVIMCEWNKSFKCGLLEQGHIHETVRRQVSRLDREWFDRVVARFEGRE